MAGLPDEAAVEAALALFRALAGEVGALPGAVALANTHVEYLLANAAWVVPGAGPTADPDREVVAAIVAWYRARGLPPAWVRTDVGAARTGAGTDVDRFAVWAMDEAPRWPEGAPAAAGVEVEQIGWAHTRAFGEVAATVFSRPALSVSVATDLTRALQADSSLRAFIAYAGDGPIGAALAYPYAGRLATFTLGNGAAAIRRRLVEDALDATLAPLLIGPLAHADRVPLAVLVRRWAVAG